VQERLGHSQISTTLDTYSHVLPGMQEDAGRDLPARICRDLQTGGPQEEKPLAKP
jgi:integrase